MCSSVEGFSASAALHPVTLLGADPVAVLVARCQDPAAGLDGYGPRMRSLRAPAGHAAGAHSQPEPGTRRCSCGAHAEAHRAAGSLPVGRDRARASPVSHRFVPRSLAPTASDISP